MTTLDASTAADADLSCSSPNLAALTPVSFLSRAADVYPDHLAVVYGSRRFSYRDLLARCRRLASALVRHGVQAGDTVCIIAPNVPAHVEAHFGVIMAGAVLNSVNIRLEARTVGYILEHSQAKIVLVDTEFATLLDAALKLCRCNPMIINIDDLSADARSTAGELEYESFIASGDPQFEWSPPLDEWAPIALNYTSGTTGNPKGVVYSHRGAYLNAIGNALGWAMQPQPVYLWTLPLFHCNGWCFPWTITALGGTHVCLRRVDAEPIFQAIKGERVTHFCGAPTVMSMLVNASSQARDHLAGIRVMTAGAAPPSAVIAAMEALGIEVTHAYGLTETYGPAVVCAWHVGWDLKPSHERAALKACQGVRYPVLEALDVVDPETMVSVPADGTTLGEVVFRGNIVMKGYLKDAVATSAAFSGGWFHSGDLAVRHPNGYIQIKDRTKDIIISGGENISTIEVEGILYQHPDIMEAAVVARPDALWGESPCAFVTLKPGARVSAEEIIAFCRERLAHFKAPKSVIFGELPKTATGKIQKFILRERARAPIGLRRPDND